VRLAYTNPDNPLRASIIRDPLFDRTNTRDNTPAVVHFDMIAGDCVTVAVAAKGGGSENKAKFANLDPAASVANWVVQTVETLGAKHHASGGVVTAITARAAKERPERGDMASLRRFGMAVRAVIA
jgi:tartrate dehydratase alpha subunit/fumarate hydratase class I-like protein